jgi:hypothetical protein
LYQKAAKDVQMGLCAILSSDFFLEMGVGFVPPFCDGLLYLAACNTTALTASEDSPTTAGAFLYTIEQHKGYAMREK